MATLNVSQIRAMAFLYQESKEKDIETELIQMLAGLLREIPLPSSNILQRKNIKTLDLANDKEIVEMFHKCFSSQGEFLEHSLGLDVWKMTQPDPEKANRAVHQILAYVRQPGTYLSLCGCGMTTVPECVWQFKELTLLSLQFNQLTFIPRELEKLNNLEILLLQNNCLTDLPNGLNMPKKLMMMDLSNNQFTKIPQLLLKKPMRTPSLIIDLVGNNFLHPIIQKRFSLNELINLNEIYQMSPKEFQKWLSSRYNVSKLNPAQIEQWARKSSLTAADKQQIRDLQLHFFQHISKLNVVFAGSEKLSSNKRDIFDKFYVKIGKRLDKLREKFVALLELCEPNDGDLICPITQELPIDPVYFLHCDGTLSRHFYERKASEEWLNKQLIDPMTREPVLRTIVPADACVQKRLQQLEKPPAVISPPLSQPSLLDIQHILRFIIPSIFY